VGIAQPGIHDRAGGAAALALPVLRGLPAGPPPGTAIDHIIPRVYGGPHRRWNLQLLHQECNSAKGSKITAGALELADVHRVRISMDIGDYRADVRRRAATYAVRATRQLGGEARDRALAAARKSPAPNSDRLAPRIAR